MKVSPRLVLALGILIASSAAIQFKAAQTAGAPWLVIAAGRLLVASLVLVPLTAWRAPDTLARLRWPDLALALGAGVLLALHFATWFASLVYTSVASSTALVATVPIWAALASHLFWRQRHARNVWLGMAVAVAGSVLIGISDSGGDASRLPLLGDGLALLGAMAGAGYFLVGQQLRARLALLPYITLVYGSAAVVLLVATLASGQPLVGYAPVVYFVWLGLALGPQLLGHTAFNWSLRYLSATYVAVAGLGEPIGASILALLVLNQIPAPLQILGSLVLLAGIALASSRPAARAKPHDSPSEV